ncbi:MAG: hypothetical protein ACI857_000190 [Arenicella sp.]|jgi:hypothetical protein
MKKLKLILAIGLITSVGAVNAQSMKDKLKAKMEKAGGGGKKGKFTTYDFEDESGISGTYFCGEIIYGKHATVGFDFAKEKDGEIVNELVVDFGTDQGKRNTMKFTQKEKYKSKHDISYFYTQSRGINVTGVGVNDHWRFVEIGTDIYAFVHDKDEKVMSVVAKDSSVLGDYDTETAQVLFDQKMAIINREKMEKESAVWLKNELYAKNVGKIVFANEDHQLCKRGYHGDPPMVTGKDFKTVLDMAGNMNYMAMFKLPPSKAYPGMEINVQFEMGGKSTNRVEYRAKSAAWGKMIPRMETKSFEDRQHMPKALRTYNSMYSQWVQDYAFMQLLYMNKDAFKIGGKYDLAVKMFVSRDGENGDMIGEGNVQLLYSEEADLVYNGNPEKPEVKSAWAQFEEFLDE